MADMTIHAREVERLPENLPVARLWLRVLAAGGGDDVEGSFCEGTPEDNGGSIASRILVAHVEAKGELDTWKECDFVA